MFREGHQIGRYTLVRQLGRGGFGEVWLAEQHSQFVTRKVALKLPLDEQVDLEPLDARQLADIITWKRNNTTRHLKI